MKYPRVKEGGRNVTMWCSQRLNVMPVVAKTLASLLRAAKIVIKKTEDPEKYFFRNIKMTIFAAFAAFARLMDGL
jgi:hypothetical protein